MSLLADKLRWAARKAARKCGRCSNPLPPGRTSTSCERCLSAVKESARKHYWRVRGIVPPPRGRMPTVRERKLAAEYPLTTD